MFPTLLGAGLAGTPGLAIALATHDLLVGWLVTLAGIAVVLILMRDRRPVIRPQAVSANAGMHALEREILRARRYGRPVTLVRIQPEPATPITLAEVLGVCREVDIVWDDDGFWLAAADTDAAAREGLVARLAKTVPGLSTGGSIEARTFPDDALTMHALMDQLSDPRMALPATAASAKEALDALGSEPLAGQARGSGV